MRSFAEVFLCPLVQSAVFTSPLGACGTRRKKGLRSLFAAVGWVFVFHWTMDFVRLSNIWDELGCDAQLGRKTRVSGRLRDAPTGAVLLE